MRNSFLAIALAVATMPFTFAAQTPKPAAGTAAQTSTTAPTNKPKKHKRARKHVKPATTAASVKSAVPVKK